jgi:glycosyltransferase involved in cell wall biosynthesis
LARRIAEHGLAAQARLLGHRNDVPAVLSLLDVFVLPSLGEGMCNTVLEAMAAGLPVVATRVGGNPELVQAGTTGQLIPARDAAALAAAIARYIDAPALRREHGAAGRTRVHQEFTLEAMVDGYVQLYTREVERKRCAA